MIREKGAVPPAWETYPTLVIFSINDLELLQLGSEKMLLYAFHNALRTHSTQRHRYQYGLNLTINFGILLVISNPDLNYQLHSLEDLKKPVLKV